MNIEIGFKLRNSESLETYDDRLSVSVSDEFVQGIAIDLSKNLTANLLTIFAHRLMGNSELDASEAEGVALKEVARMLCWRTFDKLGWHDVTATIASLKINDVRLDLSADEIQDAIHDELMIQLERDENTIYFCQ